MNARFVDALNYPSFSYSDYGFACSLSSRNLDNISINVAYDAACSYTVNVKARFGQHLPTMKDLVARCRFTIDSLHVNDHIEKCLYLFSTNYQDAIGHFHGVGTEQYWSENNQMGPQTRQMNPGHRQDKISAHHSDWNWKKTTRHGKHVSTNIVLLLLIPPQQLLLQEI